MFVEYMGVKVRTRTDHSWASLCASRTISPRYLFIDGETEMRAGFICAHHVPLSIIASVPTWHLSLSAQGRPQPLWGKPTCITELKPQGQWLVGTGGKHSLQASSPFRRGDSEEPLHRLAELSTGHQTPVPTAMPASRCALS